MFIKLCNNNKSTKKSTYPSSRKLQNYDFDLKITVNEEITKKYTYTDREIYEKMTELNPKLDVFRQQLDLDF